MPRPVSLRAVVDALHRLDGRSAAFLHRPSGALAVLTEADRLVADASRNALSAAEPDRAAAVGEIRTSGDWLALPDASALHPLRILERFCDTVPAEDGGDGLRAAVRERGPFRRFRTEAERLDLDARWLAFQANAVRRIAAEWLAAHDVPYHDDVGRPTTTCAGTG